MEGLNVFVQSLLNFIYKIRIGKLNGSRTIAVDIQLAFVGGNCWFVIGKLLHKTRENIKYRNLPTSEKFSDCLWKF